jgi:hypothetical protein
MSTPEQPSSSAQILQVLLRQQYRDLARRGANFPELADVEFRSYSQNGEDGILLYLFSLLGTTNRRVVEICAGDGFECNAANLIVNHGWQALLVDGDTVQVSNGRQFYASCRNTWVSPPIFIQEWITAENVEATVARQGFGGSIDLLSLDLDGNDYWIWKALDCVVPRVVVIEFNAACGPERSLTVAYQPDFRLDFSKPPYCCGASLPALVKLGREKGYRLVGIDVRGINAFFVRNGLGESLLPERSAVECYDRTERLRGWSPDSLEALLSGLTPWEDV